MGENLETRPLKIHYSIAWVWLAVCSCMEGSYLSRPISTFTFIALLDFPSKTYSCCTWWSAVFFVVGIVIYFSSLVVNNNTSNDVS